jgi:hypothetical protein
LIKTEVKKMDEKRLAPVAFGYSAALISAIFMLLLGISGKMGIYTGAVEQMMKWHMFFSLSTGGIIAGMAEAALISFVFVFAFALIYNRSIEK